MPPRLKRYLPPLISLAIIATFGWFLVQNWDRYRQLIDFSMINVLGLVMLVALFTLSNGLINFTLYRGLGADIGLNEGVGLAAVNTLANQLPFAGGMIAKGAYLRKQHQMPYTKFFSATVALYNCIVAANGALGVLIIIYWWALRQSPMQWPLLVGFSVMMMALFLFWIPVDFVSSVKMLPPKWKRRFEQLIGGWRVFSSNRKMTIQLVGLQLFISMLFAWRFWIAFNMLSQPITYSQCLIFAAATVLTRLVSISPGGLGVREAIVAALAAFAGYDADVALVAVGLDRMIALVFVVVAGTIYSYVLGKKVVETD